MPGKAENKQSEKGMYKGHGKREKSKVSEDMVGSSGSHGVRFPVPDHHDKSDLHSPEKG